MTQTVVVAAQELGQEQLRAVLLHVNNVLARRVTAELFAATVASRQFLE